MDFFTVPTHTFGVLYCFFVIRHDRCRILHFNVTRNPHALWVVQQLREVWAYQQADVGPAQVTSSKVTDKVPRNPAKNSTIVAAFVSRMDSMIILLVKSITATEIVA